MIRRTLLAVATVAVLAGLMPAVTMAAPPEGYRVIDSRHADGGMSSVDGCVGTDVFFGSTDAVFGGRPGTINKQAGPTDVAVILSDVCAEPVGKGFPVLAAWTGQTMVGLVSDARFTTASVDAWIPVTDDVTGASATAHLVMSWTASGRATPDPSHIHNRIAGVAVVNSHDNNTMVDAIAAGSVTIGGWTTEVWTDAAHLASVRASCQVVLHPGVPDADVDCL